MSEVPADLPWPVAAVVPGCVHLDLIRAGVIRHPREGFAELEQFWVGKTDWRYECEFEASEALFAHERVDLVCEGLDTIATVELNGVQIGAAGNMFHPHRFEAKGAIRRGENRLAITFKSPLRHIREEEARLGARPVNGDWDPYVFIRKAASNFGWDWAPKVPTCGVWKGIGLEGWSAVRISGVRPQARRTRSDSWRVSIAADLEWTEQAPPDLLLGVSLEEHGLDAWASTVPSHGRPTTTLSFDVDNPRVWWPRGHGDQPLYNLRLSLLQANGVAHRIADGWVGRIGFREVRLHTEPDEYGSRFEIHVNGKPIFCKGANWIPEGLFPTEVTRDTYRARIRAAADANMNMLRVWGGGFYEDDAFYELCDELGILVWQDFMFACAMYPEEAPYPALVEAEARHQITRLSSHPSVALWCGGNECVWAFESWGNAPGEQPWKERVGDKTWGRGYYFDLLPRLVEELDPTKPYWANSPWSGSESVRSNDVDHGDRHTWDVCVEGYRTIVPRFCSEFGHQSPANIETLERAIGAGELLIGSRELEHRQRGTGGTSRHIDAAIVERFGTSTDFRQWHSRAQLMQQIALKTGIEWMRIQRPRCMGALIWQLNDAWPGMSWSLIDTDGDPKPSLAWVREAFAPRIITIQPVDGRPVVFGVNDLDEAWESAFTLIRHDLEGGIVREETGLRFMVPAAGVARLADVEEVIGLPGKDMREVVVAHTDRLLTQWVYMTRE